MAPPVSWGGYLNSGEVGFGGQWVSAVLALVFLPLSTLSYSLFFQEKNLKSWSNGCGGQKGHYTNGLFVF